MLPVDFHSPELPSRLADLTAEQLDGLAFGLIGFDADDRVQAYNRLEAAATGLDPLRVRGLNVFTELAQCMNNFLVAERFRSAREQLLALDETLPYTLTWRMRPTPVRLRLIWAPGAALAFIALERLA